MQFAVLKTSGWIVQVMDVGASWTLVSDDGYEYKVANSDLREVLPTDKGGWECA